VGFRKKSQEVDSIAHRGNPGGGKRGQENRKGRGKRDSVPGVCLVDERMTPLVENICCPKRGNKRRRQCRLGGTLGKDCGKPDGKRWGVLTTDGF